MVYELFIITRPYISGGEFIVYNQKQKPKQTKLKMKYLFTLALLNAAAMAKLRVSPGEEGLFLGLTAQFNHSYEKMEDLEKALGAFQHNSATVNEMNSKAKGVTFALN